MYLPQTPLLEEALGPRDLVPKTASFSPVFVPVFQDILEDSVPVYVGFLVMMAWAPGPWCLETTRRP